MVYGHQMPKNTDYSLRLSLDYTVTGLYQLFIAVIMVCNKPPQTSGTLFASGVCGFTI